MSPFRNGITRIIDADKPLGFYVLALLIVEVFLTTVLVLSNLTPDHKYQGMWAGVGMFVFLILVVSLLVWRKPNNLIFTGEQSLAGMGIRPPYGTDRSVIAEKSCPAARTNQSGSNAIRSLVRLLRFKGRPHGVF